MVKLIAPLGSFSASGIIGPRLVFSQRASGAQVRFQKSQNDRLTAARVLVRDKYIEGVVAWKNLSEIEKLEYKSLASGSGISGYNLFMKEYLKSEEPPIIDGTFALFSYNVPVADSVNFALSIQA